MQLYFVGGASGSGKTAMIPALKKKVGHAIKVYDFDEKGVPLNADAKWRQQTTEKWLQKLLADGKDACLLGQIVLGELMACPAARSLGEVHFCLLDVSDVERIQRLKKRSTHDVNQSTLNWAAWLRMHTCDPQWEQHVIKDGAWRRLDFASWDQKKSWPEIVKTKVIDTTALDRKPALKETRWKRPLTGFLRNEGGQKRDSV